MSPRPNPSVAFLPFCVALTLLCVGCPPAGPPGAGGGDRGPGGDTSQPRPPPGQADCTAITGEARLPEGAGEALGDLEVFFLEPGSIQPDGFPNKPPMDFLHVTGRKGLPFVFRGCAPQAKLEIAAFIDMDGDQEIRGVGDRHGHTVVTVSDAGLSGVVVLLDRRIEEAKKD